MYMVKKGRDESKGIQCDNGPQVKGNQIIQSHQGQHGQKLPQNRPCRQPAGTESLGGIQQQHPAQQIAQQQFMGSEGFRPHIHHLRRRHKGTDQICQVYYPPYKKRVSPHLPHTKPLCVPENEKGAPKCHRYRNSEEGGRKDLVKYIGRDIVRQPQTEHDTHGKYDIQRPIHKAKPPKPTARYGRPPAGRGCP